MFRKIKMFKYRHMLKLLKTVPCNRLLSIKIGMEDGWINEPIGLYDAVLVVLHDDSNIHFYDSIQRNYMSDGIFSNNDLCIISEMYSNKKNKRK